MTNTTYPDFKPLPSAISGFYFYFCCEVLYAECGKETTYGHYRLPPSDQAGGTSSTSLLGHPEHVEAKKTYKSTEERLGGCDFFLPCVLALGCPKKRFKYTDNRGAPLPQLRQVDDSDSSAEERIAKKKAYNAGICCRIGIVCDQTIQAKFKADDCKTAPRAPAAPAFR